MTGRAATRRRLNAFEEERREAIESAMEAFAERPGDRVTEAACAYLLNHLTRSTVRTSSQDWLPTAA